MSQPRAAASKPSAAPTFPCPGCGRPVVEGSVLCTHCGQQLAKGEQFETKIGRPEKGLPPIPAIAPGPAAFRDSPVDYLGRKEAIKPFVVLFVSLAFVAGTKALGSGGLTEAGNYLVRYGVWAAGGLALFAMGTIMFIEIGVSARLAVFAVLAAMAGGDLVQHIISFTLMPALAWVAAIVVCLCLLADFLEMDFPDAVFLTFAIYLLKFALKFTLFAAPQAAE